jgi:hypothetical protein
MRRAGSFAFLLALLLPNPARAGGAPPGFSYGPSCATRRDLRAALTTPLATIPVRGLLTDHAVDETLGLTYIIRLDRYHDPTSLLSIVDTATGKVLHTVDTGAVIETLIVDGSRRHVIVLQGSLGGDVSRVSLLDAESGALLHVTHLSAPFGSPHSDDALVLNRTAGRLFLGLQFGSGVAPLLYVFDTSTGALLRTMALKGIYFLDMAGDTQTHRVFATYGDLFHGFLSMFDATTGALLRTMSTGDTLGDLTLDEPSGHVFVTLDRIILMLDAGSGTVLATLPVPDVGLTLALAQRASRLFVFTGEHTAQVRDTRMGALVAQVEVITHPNDPNAFIIGDGVFERAGLVFIFSSGGRDKQGDAVIGPAHLQVFEAASGRLVQTITLGRASGVYSGILGHDDRRGRAFLQNADGTLRLVDITCL